MKVPYSFFFFLVLSFVPLSSLKPFSLSLQLRSYDKQSINLSFSTLSASQVLFCLCIPELKTCNRLFNFLPFNATFFVYHRFSLILHISYSRVFRLSAFNPFLFSLPSFLLLSISPSLHCSVLFLFPYVLSSNIAFNFFTHFSQISTKLFIHFPFTFFSHSFHLPFYISYIPFSFCPLPAGEDILSVERKQMKPESDMSITPLDVFKC